MSRRLSSSQRRAALHLAGLKKDENTGLWCCWVCARPMDPVLYASGFASHPDCDPGEVSERFPPEKEPAWLRMKCESNADERAGASRGRPGRRMGGRSADPGHVPSVLRHGTKAQDERPRGKGAWLNRCQAAGDTGLPAASMYL